MNIYYTPNKMSKNFAFFFLLLLYALCLPLQAGESPSSTVQTFQKKLKPSPCVIVIFGATGDLTAKKLFPALYNLAKKGDLSENTVVVALARKKLTHVEFRQQMNEMINRSSRKTAEKNLSWEEFKNKTFYQQVEFDQHAGYENLQKFLMEIDSKFGTQGNRLYYLATPPSYFPSIIEQLHKQRLIYCSEDTEWSRVLIEKPFGIDFDTAIDLQKQISDRLAEEQVFRIDHYLGKEGVQKLLTLRFENSHFEPLWNNQHIENIQITMSEDIGIGTRGNFWENTGALRDFFQNHLMQLLTIVAMEPPHELRADKIHQAKINLLKAIRPFPSGELDHHLVRGQYGPGVVKGQPALGYRQEPSVSVSSNIETYMAAKIIIDNERWQGVPFYIRGGKRLPQQVTEIVVTFKAQQDKESDILFIRIQPNMGIFYGTKEKGFVPMRYNLGTSFDSYPEAYEKLIYDALQGDRTLFVEAEEQIEAWRILTPVLRHWEKNSPKKFPNYPAGSWGPAEAEEMLLEKGHQWEHLETN